MRTTVGISVLATALLVAMLASIRTAQAQECDGYHQAVCDLCGKDSPGCRQARKETSDYKCEVGSRDLAVLYSPGIANDEAAQLMQQVCGHSRPSRACAETIATTCKVCGEKGETCRQIKGLRAIATCESLTLEMGLLAQTMASKPAAERDRLIRATFCLPSDRKPAQKPPKKTAPESPKTTSTPAAMPAPDGVACAFVTPGDENLLAKRFAGYWVMDPVLHEALSQPVKDAPKVLDFKADPTAQEWVSRFWQRQYSRDYFNSSKEALKHIFLTGTGTICFEQDVGIHFSLQVVNGVSTLVLYLPGDVIATFLPIQFLPGRKLAEDRLAIYEYHGTLGWKAVAYYRRAILHDSGTTR